MDFLFQTAENFAQVQFGCGLLWRCEKWHWLLQVIIMTWNQPNIDLGRLSLYRKSHIECIICFSSVKWNYCILDEGHIIKNSKTKVCDSPWIPELPNWIPSFMLYLCFIYIWNLFLAVIKGCKTAELQPSTHSLRDTHSEQCPRAVVTLWLPDAWISGNWAPVPGEIRSSNTPQSRCQELIQRARSRWVIKESELFASCSHLSLSSRCISYGGSPSSGVALPPASTQRECSSGSSTQNYPGLLLWAQSSASKYNHQVSISYWPLVKSDENSRGMHMKIIQQCP